MRKRKANNKNEQLNQPYKILISLYSPEGIRLKQYLCPDNSIKSFDSLNLPRNIYDLVLPFFDTVSPKFPVRKIWYPKSLLHRRTEITPISYILLRAGPHVDELIPNRNKLLSISSESVKENLNLLKSIGFKDLIVRSDGTKCLQNHDTFKITASIPLILGSEIKRQNVPAFYCNKCNTFFITESVYHSLKSKGLFACRVITKNINTNSTTGIYSNLNQHSLLNEYGYNVSKNSEMTEKDRQNLLSFLIKSETMKLGVIIGYLNYFIDSRENMTNMQEAVIKWKADREFVTSLKEKRNLIFYPKKITVQKRNKTKSSVKKIDNQG